jgi:SMC interacting uncharacterized protein involved in chromosome segregation
MKRILVRESLDTRVNSLKKSLREGNWLTDDLNTRVSSLRKLVREGNRMAVDLNKRSSFLKKSLREGERSTIDLEALQKVQEQFDGFIRQMIEAKVLLAGLEIGGDDAYYEDYERETRETGEIK